MAAIFDFSELNKQAGESGNRLLINIQNSLAMHDKKDTGGLSKSLKFKFLTYPDYLSLTLQGSFYWKFVDRGVRGAKNSKNTTSPYSFKNKRPPFDVIQAWAQRKGLLTGSEKQNISHVFGLQKSIFEKGIAATDIFTDNIKFFQEKEENKLQEAAKRDIERIINMINYDNGSK